MILKKETLCDSVRDYLRDQIISRELLPGERLIETRIAKELGVSQAPVREAIRELSLMGFVDTVPYSGSHVRKISNSDIRDNYRIKALLESFAIKEIIAREDAEDLHKIENAYKDLMHSYNSAKPMQNTELDIAFHNEIVRAGRMAALEKIWFILNMSQWTFVTNSSNRAPYTEFKRLHRGIFQALMDRDSEAACRFCEEHYELASAVAMEWTEHKHKSGKDKSESTARYSNIHI